MHGEILERVEAFESKGGDGWDHRMGEDLVCLTYCISGYIFPNIGEEVWPPVLLREEHDGV